MDTLIGNFILTSAKQLNLKKIKTGVVKGYSYFPEDGKLIVVSENALTQNEIDSIASEVIALDESEPNYLVQKRARKRQLLDALATLTGLTRKQVLKCFIEIAQDGNDD